MTNKPRQPPAVPSQPTPLQSEVERLQACIDAVAERMADDLPLADLLRAARVLSGVTLQLARLLIIQRDLGGSVEDAEMAAFDRALEEALRLIDAGQLPS